MTCREVLDFLSDYLDGELLPDQKNALEEHLSACPFCRDYLDSYRKTIELEKQAFVEPDQPADAHVPPEILQAVLEARRKRAPS